MYVVDPGPETEINAEASGENWNKKLLNCLFFSLYTSTTWPVLSKDAKKELFARFLWELGFDDGVVVAVAAAVPDPSGG